jgi:hypothetical protein
LTLKVIGRLAVLRGTSKIGSLPRFSVQKTLLAAIVGVFLIRSEPIAMLAAAPYLDFEAAKSAAADALGIK